MVRYSVGWFLRSQLLTMTSLFAEPSAHYQVESLHLPQLAQGYLQAAADIAPTLEGKLRPRSINKVWLNCTKPSAVGEKTSS